MGLLVAEKGPPLRFAVRFVLFGREGFPGNLILFAVVVVVTVSGAFGGDGAAPVGPTVVETAVQAGMEIRVAAGTCLAEAGLRLPLPFTSTMDTTPHQSSSQIGAGHRRRGRRKVVPTAEGTTCHG